jgi:PAS domain S-box-containing protein
MYQGKLENFTDSKNERAEMNRWLGKSPRNYFAQCWIACAVMFISLAATLWVVNWSQQEIRKRQQTSFEQEISKFQHTMELYFSSYCRVLNSVGSYFSQESLPSNTQFKQFLEAQGIRTNHPGMFDMGYVARVRPQDQSLFDHFALAEGIPQAERTGLPKPSPEHYILAHWDDFSERKTSPIGGFDFLESERLAAMRQAGDTGEITSTGKLNIHTGNDAMVPNGFILYAPVYRLGAPLRTQAERQEALKGFAFASFFIADFGQAIYQAAGGPLIGFDVYEGDKIAPDKLWHTSRGHSNPGGTPSPSRSPRFDNIQQINSLGREWTLYCVSLPEFENTPEVKIPTLMLLAGTGVSILLFILTLIQTQARIRGENLAAKLHVITQKMLVEKERMSVTLSSINEGVITADTEAKIVLLNRVAEEKTGQILSHAKGKLLAHVFRLGDPDAQANLSQRVQAVLETGIVWHTSQPVTLRSHDGVNPPISATISPLRGAQGEIHGVVLVFHDVTERQKLLEEQIKTGKLESIGMLAGGIAHDFNNLLTAILGNISIASFSSDPNECRQCLVEAEQACGRARDLTQQLLTFAKGGAPIRKTAVLGDAIRESARFATHGSATLCECQLPEDMWPVDADKGQISQVIHNLVINAAQAMPEGGIIEILAENLALDPCNRQNIAAGRYVHLAVTDQGPGIPPEHLNRIFDPYFTTKAKGSGLGLATCYSIIKRHDGIITVESKPGAGTRFDIYLPASNRLPPPMPSVIARTTPAAAAISGNRRILVMDDEEPVLHLLTKMLKKLGYQTLGAVDGAEAVRLFAEAKAKHQAIDAVILDLTVPGGTGGRQALRQMLAIDPGVKAIVSSGYSSDWVMSNFENHGFQAVVSKPYDIDTLASALEQVICPSSTAPG